MNTISEASFFKVRVVATGLIALAIGLLLTWNYYHGGIPSHHILADKTLPKISNLWGALLLPLLTWVLLYRAQKRIFMDQSASVQLSSVKYALYAFVTSFLYGVVLSIFFRYGYSGMTSNMMLGIFVLALFFPLYRAECLLGFVIGMTYTFGAVLPTGIGSILAIIAFAIFRGVRPGVLYIVSSFRKS